MRIDEFSRAVCKYQKQSRVACVLPFSIALICLLVYAPFRQPLEVSLSKRFSPEWVDVLISLPMALPVILAIAALIPLSRRIDKRAGIPCPHCGKTLANFKTIVIASRNCPHCGKRVLEEPE